LPGPSEPSTADGSAPLFARALPREKKSANPGRDGVVPKVRSWRAADVLGPGPAVEVEVDGEVEVETKLATGVNVNAGRARRTAAACRRAMVKGWIRARNGIRAFF
jgi:hypothetical protein